MSFILDEDLALRNFLLDMVVHDQKADASVDAGRKVGVFFGQPDLEIRDQAYPYVTIDLIDISEDRMRAHRGRVSPEYLTPSDLGENEGWQVDYPIPVNLDYQVTTYSRQPRHDREILQQLLYERLKFRFGILMVGEYTTRRLDVLDISKRDSTENGKRLFMNAFTVRVSSEIVQSQIAKFQKVETVYVDPPASDSGWDGVTFTEPPL